MDSQLKKGLVEYSVLANLAQGDSYGYELLTKAPTALALTESTLYRLLKRLEQDGRVTTYTKAFAGRTRRYYHLTAIGATSIQEFLQDWDAAVAVHDDIVWKIGGSK